MCARELEQAARGGRFEGERWQTRKDGSRFWASVVITAIRDPGNGSLLGFSNVTDDLTQRRRTEEALRESEERFRLTIDEAPIGMALVSLDGRFVRVNRSFCEVVGYPPGDLMNLTFREITHPEDVDTDLALAGQLARGEIPRCQFEKRYLRKDGTVVDTTVSVSILRDAAGAPLYYISQIEDITERKRVEKELRDANAFLDAIIENIPLMLFIKESASLRFVRFNRAGEDLLGWPRQSLVGKNDFDFWPREQAEFFIQKDRETAEGRRGGRNRRGADSNAPSRCPHPAHEEGSDPRSVRQPALSARHLGGHHGAKANREGTAPAGRGQRRARRPRSTTSRPWRP